MPDGPRTPHYDCVTDEILCPAQEKHRFVHPVQFGDKNIRSGHSADIWPLQDVPESMDDEMGGRYGEHGERDGEECYPCTRVS